MSTHIITTHRIQNIWNKLLRYKHHYRFLNTCLQRNAIPKGLKINFNLALGTNDAHLKSRCQAHLQTASKNLLTELVMYAEKSSATLQTQLEKSRKALFVEYDLEMANKCWSQAKKGTNAFSRELSLRYRSKIKNIIPLENFDLENNTINQVSRSRNNRRFSRKIKKYRKERLAVQRTEQRYSKESAKELFFPINLSSKELSDDEKSVLSKGPSFCPIPSDINRYKLLVDWEIFESRLRYALYFHKVNLQSEEVSKSKATFPTVKQNSGKKAPISKSPQLESFLESVKGQLFDPANVCKVSDNLSKGERQALKSLKNSEEHIIRIQDKGSKFVILDKLEYDSKMHQQLRNPLHYKELEYNPSSDHVALISEWKNKWLAKNQITKEIADWVINKEAKPGKAFGTIKTHKQNNPLRLITSCCGTAIENLAAFTEFYLKPLAQKQPSFVKDTTHFLQKIEELNKQGPFPQDAILVSFDVVSMFPNIDNQLGISAITTALNSRDIKTPCTECIVEAVEICLKHNNSQYDDNNFLQIHGTAMGPKNACSYADIAMGVIDNKAKSGTIKPNNWLRYRDDIFDLWLQGKTKLLDFIDFINSLHPTIKFTSEYSETSLNVLDITLRLVNGFIQTDIYSKPTDNHIYLDPASAHPKHVAKAIPKGVAIRIKRNCSTDNALAARNEEYQTYLVNRGYNKKYVKRQFEEVQSIPREDLLKPKRKQKETKKFPLVLDFNPRLPNVGKIIRENLHLLHASPTLAKLFPAGSIIPSFRRPRNIKDILSLKPRKDHNHKSQNGCFSCKAKKCDLCKNYLKETSKFSSIKTGKIYPIKQAVNCNSDKVIYLVTCKKCMIQYVGSTNTPFKVRFRNHKSSMITNKITCEVAKHYNSIPHNLDNFEFVVIEQINNNSNVHNIDELLLTREAYWCAQLFTLKPFGLNKRAEFNSKHRIKYDS